VSFSPVYLRLSRERWRYLIVGARYIVQPRSIWRLGVSQFTSRYHPRCPTDKETAAATPGTPLDGTPQLRHDHLVETHCAKCDAAMICRPEGGCWCAELPHLPVPTDKEGCLCRNCLRAKIEASLKSDNGKEAW